MISSKVFWFVMHEYKQIWKSFTLLFMVYGVVAILEVTMGFLITRVLTATFSIDTDAVNLDLFFGLDPIWMTLAIIILRYGLNIFAMTWGQSLSQAQMTLMRNSLISEWVDNGEISESGWAPRFANIISTILPNLFEKLFYPSLKIIGEGFVVLALGVCVLLLMPGSIIAIAALVGVSLAFGFTILNRVVISPISQKTNEANSLILSTSEFCISQRRWLIFGDAAAPLFAKMEKLGDSYARLRAISLSLGEGIRFFLEPLILVVGILFASLAGEFDSPGIFEVVPFFGLFLIRLKAYVVMFSRFIVDFNLADAQVNDLTGLRETIRESKSCFKDNQKEANLKISDAQPLFSLQGLDSEEVYVTSGMNLLITGPSGSGKSQLILAFLGLANNRFRIKFYKPVKPTEISFLVHGQYLPPISMIEFLDCNSFANDSLLKLLKILDLETLVCERGALAEVMHQHLFSTGQAQRLFLLRALIRNPRLLIIDEGISGVDETIRHDIIRYLIDSDIVVIYVSHHITDHKLFLGHCVFPVSKGFLS